MFKPGDIVQIKPITKKMKDRVNLHGRKMVVTQVKDIMIDGVPYDTLLISLDKSFKIANEWQLWSGWVKVGRDCELI